MIPIFKADSGFSNLVGLVTLLKETVDAGASIGFLAPLQESEAQAYWEEVLHELSTTTRLLLIASDGDTIAGSVQLAMPTKPNGRHRAEVQKLMVRPAYRNQGLGRALMAAIESEAHAQGRYLLVLDTRAGDVAEALYPRIGYLRAGSIPGYALNSEGGADATVFFYKELPH
jgi:ribosomal protein S18 acetylase RimI-like enzyme